MKSNQILNSYQKNIVLITISLLVFSRRWFYLPFEMFGIAALIGTELMYIFKYRKYFQLVSYNRDLYTNVITHVNVIFLVGALIRVLRLIANEKYNIEELVATLDSEIFIILLLLSVFHLSTLFINRKYKELVISLSFLTFSLNTVVSPITSSINYYRINTNDFTLLRLEFFLIFILVVYVIYSLFFTYYNKLYVRMNFSKYTFKQIIYFLTVILSSSYFCSSITELSRYQMNMTNIVIELIVTLFSFIVVAYIVNLVIVSYIPNEITKISKDLFLKGLLLFSIISLFHFNYFYSATSNEMELTGTITLLTTIRELLQIAILTFLIKKENKYVWIRKRNIL